MEVIVSLSTWTFVLLKSQEFRYIRSVQVNYLAAFLRKKIITLENKVNSSLMEVECCFDERWAMSKCEVRSSSQTSSKATTALKSLNQRQVYLNLGLQSMLFSSTPSAAMVHTYSVVSKILLSVIPVFFICQGISFRVPVSPP